MLIDSMLKHRVALLRMERDDFGNLTEVAVHGNLRAFVMVRKEETVERGIQQVRPRHTVYLEAKAPLDDEHDDWRLRYNGDDTKVLLAERRENPITGSLSHWKLTLE